MDSEPKETLAKWRTRAYATWTVVGLCILVGVVLYICNILWQAVATIIVTALAVFLLHGGVNLYLIQHLADPPFHPTKSSTK